MSAARVGVFVLLASALACGPGRSRPPTARGAEHSGPRHAAARERETDGPRRSGVTSSSQPKVDGPVAGEYVVRYDGHGVLTVEATLAFPTRRLAVESGAENFVEDFEVAGSSNAPWIRGARQGRAFEAAPCAAGPCRLRYRYRLRDAARTLDDLAVASEEGAVIEAPPSTWLLAPENTEDSARVRFRVSTAENTSFHTGVFRSREAPDAWDIALRDLWTAPYSVFGPLRERTLEESARLDLVIAPGKLVVTDDDVGRWVSGSARAISAYFGRFPLPETLVIVVPSRGRWVGEGMTLSGGGGAVFLRLGEAAPPRALREDWVLVHEMTHLAFPSVAREHDWAEEGLATYVEPIARARAGVLSTEAAWYGLVDSLPKGLPAAGDRGLDRTRTWGRTYWGGALFYLLADVDIRKRTKNAVGLEHALRGILAAGGNNAQRWTLDDAFAAGDMATGVPALRELHAAMADSPHPVDLDALWHELGIVRTHGSVRFDESAPLAAVRRAITTTN